MRYFITLLILLTFNLFTYPQTRTYTLDADFDEGTLINVNHDPPNNNQLQLSNENIILPFIWVPNQEGTVSKVDTETGKELGRYWVATPPEGVVPSYPSRTTVDLQGNCWVGNRQRGTVVKIGLYEAGQYIDRNGNGTIETSTDLDNDGNITGAEILPWGQDECVLYEIVLISGKQGTYTPGTYVQGYDYDYWGTAPRGLAIDASNNLWAGTWISSKYFYIDGSTGTILNTLDVAPWGHNAYGAVIDGNGVLWSAELNDHILRINPSVSPPNILKINLSHTYGLGLDYQGNLFVGGNYQLSKIDVNNTTTPIVWTKSARTQRGVVCTVDNNVWVAGIDASGNYNSVSRYDNDGNLVTTITGFNQPSGVAVDAAGKVWVTDIIGINIHRIDPAVNTIDLTKGILGSTGHYTYSDMTGIIARTITTQIGTWNVVYDSEVDGLPWGTISWNDYVPEGTSVTVKVRSSNDQITWSTWETTTNGVLLSSTPDGRYLEVQVTFQILSGEVSPILYDLTVQSAVQFVDFDIKPQSCPNPLNVREKGVIPVAILGTTDFDVLNVDLETVLLEGVAPIRWNIEDVATPVTVSEQCACTTDGPDGFYDLTLKFNAQEIIAAIGPVINGEELELTITGNLNDGTPIEGSDCVIIRANGINPRITNKLIENYPNPFNPSTTIQFTVPERTYVKLEVFNSIGEKVTTLVAEELERGEYSYIWDGKDLPSGIYIYRIQSDIFLESKKMLLLK